MNLLKALRFVRFYLLIVLVWTWTLIWGLGLSIAFLFVGGHRNFLPLAVRILSYPIQWMCGIKVEMENEQGLYLYDTCIYAGNHQSGFDVPIFGIYTPPNLIWIAKKELGSLPFIGWVLKRTNNILIDRKNRERAFKQLEEAGQKITLEKRRVAIFPEGTRNTQTEELLPFKRGPFFLAKAAGAPIIPVVCSSLKQVTNARTGQLGGRVKLRVLPPFFPQGSPEEMAVQLREKMQAAFQELNQELQRKV